MKSKLCVFAIVAVIGFVIGCDNGNNPQSGTPTFTVSFDSAGGSAVPPQSVMQGGIAIEPYRSYKAIYSSCGAVRPCVEKPTELYL